LLYRLSYQALLGFYNHAGDELALCVSDPTHKNTGTIELELDRAIADVIEADPRVTVIR
jgi:hypothetical protein